MKKVLWVVFALVGLAAGTASFSTASDIHDYSTVASDIHDYSIVASDIHDYSIVASDIHDYSIGDLA